MAGIVKFDGEVLRVKSDILNLAVDLEGNLEAEIFNEEKETIEVSGLGREILKFMAALLDKYELKPQRARMGLVTPIIEFSTGKFDWGVTADETMWIWLQGNKTLRLEAGKVTKLVLWAGAVEIWKELKDPEDYSSEVGNLMMKHKLGVKYERTSVELRGDKLYIVAENGDDVIAISPTEVEQFYIICGGVGRNAEWFYEWLIRLLEKYGSKFKIKEKEDEYQISFGNLKIYYVDLVIRKNLKIKYEIKEGKIKFLVEFSGEDVVIIYEPLFYILAKGDEQRLKKYIDRVSEIIKEMVRRQSKL